MPSADAPYLSPISAPGGCPSPLADRPNALAVHQQPRRPLLIAFMPVFSAISGNIGLQSSAINARALALGLINPSEWRGAISHELKAGLILALVCGLLVGFVSANFPDPSHCQRSPDFFFGSAVGFSMFCSMLVASLNGAVAPLIFVRLGYDPTALAGPLETAFQDVCGNILFLSLASFILRWDHGVAECGGG